MKKIIVRALLVFMAVSVPNLIHAQKTSTQQQAGEVVITQPEFKGGSEALYKYILINFEYPEEAAKRSISGTMEVEFTIEKSGDVSNVGILKGLDEQVDEQVLRLLKA
ncbi:MAG: TonB family protein, partial [Bacteroidaceae bacterium]|nr:TonB family protein [Bacteroidaceae bacterium]